MERKIVIAEIRHALEKIHGIAIDHDSYPPTNEPWMTICANAENALDSLSKLEAPEPRAERINGAEIQEVLTYLNNQTNRGFRWAKPNGRPTAHADRVRALLKSGYTVQDCRDVIDRQVREWGNDEKMSKHLTPETLFRPCNFEKYLDS